MFVQKKTRGCLSAKILHPKHIQKTMSDKTGFFETINRIFACTKKEFSFTDTILSAYKKKEHQDKGLSLHLLVIPINKNLGGAQKDPSFGLMTSI